MSWLEGINRPASHYGDMNVCRWCGRSLHEHRFGPGSNECTECGTTVRSLRTLAKGETGWVVVVDTARTGAMRDKQLAQDLADLWKGRVVEVVGDEPGQPLLIVEVVP